MPNWSSARSTPSPTWDAVVAGEPALLRRLHGNDVDVALGAIADFVDLKSPYTLGHSRAVAELAGDAGRVLGLPAAEVDTLVRAGLVHDLGRLGVSNAIWEKAGPLGAGEWERIRMHPYLTERILCQSAALSPLGAIAVQHHERMDGSGYPRGLRGSAISTLARILAVADAYRTMREPRPHREALSADEAAVRLRADADAGRLDPDAVEAVLAAAGHRASRRHSRPAGLSPREIEILRLVARGLSSREIADALVLSTKTVRNHTEHIYAKIGAGNRVAASLFAVQNGLLPSGVARVGQRGGRPLGASSPAGFFLRDMLDTGRPAVRRYASASSRSSWAFSGARSADFMLCSACSWIATNSASCAARLDSFSKVVPLISGRPDDGVAAMAPRDAGRLTSRS